MVVLTQNRKSGVVGLHIGTGNVHRYFPREVQMVELELDHLRIVCVLEPSFWQDRPEIHDVRLSLWLESKRNSGKIAAHSAPVALIPAGTNTFRLQLTVEEHALPIVHPVAYPPPISASTPAPLAGSMNDMPSLPPGQVERRVRRRPVVRELGRLKGNELPITAAIH